MAKRSRKDRLPTEWAEQIRNLRQRLNISQGDLARKLDCSAMTVSRWESGQLSPTARYYIELGKLAGKQDCWFYWSRAGLQTSDVMSVLGARERKQYLPEPADDRFDLVAAGASLDNAQALKPVPGSKPTFVSIPVLQAIIGTHGGVGDRHANLNHIPSRDVMGAPLDWCPNPRYTSVLRVRGHSMEPLIHDGDIAAVDSSQTDPAELDGKVVIVSHEDRGMCVSRLRRYPKFNVIESENRVYPPLILGKTSGYHIIARVLWWISAAP